MRQEAASGLKIILCKNWLNTREDRMDRCAGRCVMTEIVLIIKLCKNWLNTLEDHMDRCSDRCVINEVVLDTALQSTKEKGNN